MSGIKYMILGGGGSFGIHAAKRLLEKPDTHWVYGVGRNPLREEAFSLGIEHEKRYSYRAIHLTYELDLLLEHIEQVRPHFIINFAAQGEGAVSWSNSWRFFETNCVGLSRLVESLMRSNFCPYKFVQIGTSELYGPVEAPSKEDDPIKATSPYAASKAAFDMYLLSMSKVRNLRMNIIRPSNAYCSGQLLHRVIPRAMVCGVTGTKLPLRGGNAKKSYIHAADLGDAIHLVCMKGVSGEIYNVGPDTPIGIRDLVQCCANELEIAFTTLVEEQPAREGEDAQYWLDSSKIKALGWKQEIFLADGLNSVHRWVQKYRHQLARASQNYTLRA